MGNSDNVIGYIEYLSDDGKIVGYVTPFTDVINRMLVFSSRCRSSCASFMPLFPPIRISRPSSENSSPAKSAFSSFSADENDVILCSTFSLSRIDSHCAHRFAHRIASSSQTATLYNALTILLLVKSIVANILLFCNRRCKCTIYSG